MWRQLLSETWAAVSDGEPLPAEVTVTGEPGHQPSNLPVEYVAIACTATALLAAARLRAAQRIRLDRASLAAAYRSEAHLRINGQPAPAGFAPLSGFWQARDGWIRTHANYPWHRKALLATALRTPEQWLAELPGPDGEVSAVPPPGELDDVPLAWPRPLSRYGADAASWD